MEGTLQTRLADLKMKIAGLLTETENAHGRYEQKVLDGKRDDNWPRWYATYLTDHGLPQLLDTLPTNSLVLHDLEDLLKRADDLYRAENPSEDWPTYYARYLIRLASGNQA